MPGATWWFGALLPPGGRSLTHCFADSHLESNREKRAESLRAGTGSPPISSSPGELRAIFRFEEAHGPIPRTNVGAENQLQKETKTWHFPDPGSCSSFLTIRDTIGLEHVIALAVNANGPSVDFSRLEQPTIRGARGAKLRGEADGLDTPLGQLLQNAFYAEGTRGDLERTVVDDYAIDRISWQTLPPVRKRP